MNEESGPAKSYDPHASEDRLYKFWEDSGFFTPQDDGRPAYSIVIPPPNVTGSLHMGHALNNTIQDLLIRRKRMQGFAAVWLPGTDHAGIATQNVVEKELAREGRSRDNLGREAFIERVWEWREEYGGRIIGQLKRLGCSCDWSRERFTMDEAYSTAIRRVFVELHEEGLIYRGDRIINWCPRCHTALSDIEVEHEEIEGHLWHISYPFADGSGELVVATTRPETMLGDTAVAVNPADERYKSVIGKDIRLPLTDRLIPVIADDFVDPAFGSGAVKVTPAHDPNDFEMGARHCLEMPKMLKEDGTIDLPGSDYHGQDRFEARETIVFDLKKAGLLGKTERHMHAVGHCYRCHTIIEPYLSLQWFVDMKPLAEPAIKAVADGRIAFYPDRWAKTYFDWMENIRDWCISRQIWWGHRIPAWYCESCGETIVAMEEPTTCPACSSSRIKREEDVLDTWFSSALWPFATFGWPEDTADLERFYPTAVLSTARDILYLWVARMIMTGLRFRDDIPFHRVIIHPTVFNHESRRMSKSLGTGVDPLDLIDKYGTDAVRFGLMSQCSKSQDMRFSEEKLEAGRNFANKVWNAARFVLMRCGDSAPAADPQTAADRWILSRFAFTTERVNAALEEFEFDVAARELWSFIWNELCDWYLEIAKFQLDEPAMAESTAGNMLYVLEGSLRLLHPFMPFLTEELWQVLPMRDRPASIMIADYPGEETAGFKDAAAEKELGALMEAVSSVRTVRSELTVPPSRMAKGTAVCADEGALCLLKKEKDLVGHLCRLELHRFENACQAPPHSAVAVSGALRIYVELEGLIDIDAEKARLEKEIGKAERDAEGRRRKLDGEFARRAPADVVAEEREKLASAEERLARFLEQLRLLR